MAVSASLSVSPASPARGAVVTATYSVSGAPAAMPVSITGSMTFGSTTYPGVTLSGSIPGAAAAVSYSVPKCSGLIFAQSASNPAVFTATVPASGGTAGSAAVTGSATVGGKAYAASAKVTLPGAAPVPAATVPYPVALASGHTLVSQYLPADLYAWRYQPGTTTPVVNASGVSEDPASPRNVSVAADGGLSVLRLAVTSDSDCGVIQSPGTYPTSSGVIETLIKFSGFAGTGGHLFGAWGSFWLFGENWPAGGELDAVETSYGNSFVSYHYGTGSSSTASTNPWTYTGKTVQLSPKNTTSVPALPNIVPDTWTYVTVAFGRDAAGDYTCDVYYNGTLYCTVAGPFVTGAPMWITAGTAFGAPLLGPQYAPYDQPASIDIQYVRVFS